MIASAPAQLVAENVEEQLQGDAAGAPLVDRLHILVEVAGERAELGPGLKVDARDRLRQAGAEDDAAGGRGDAEATRGWRLPDLVELGLGEPNRRQGRAAQAVGRQARPAGAAPQRAVAGSGCITRQLWHEEAGPGPRAPASRPPRARGRGQAEANGTSRGF